MRVAVAGRVHGSRALLALVSIAHLVACASPPGEALGDSGARGDADEIVDGGGFPRDASAAMSDARAIETDASAIDDAAAADTGATEVDASVSEPDAGATIPPSDAWPGTRALLRPSDPMPCADPAVVSEDDARRVYYVYCTGMSHVWTTSDWVAFRDVHASTTFDLTGMSANGRRTGAWWAPTVIFAHALGRYVMWVSVPDAGATDGADGWTARSLAVLTSPSPTGPWRFRGLAIDAAANQHFIDPFLFEDADGGRYVYWKQYGGGASSSIMGARVDDTWTDVVGTRVEVMNGYGGDGTWEDNVRENPAVWRDAAGRHHMLFSGGHWRDDTYATGHAISTCGPLCPSATSGGWHMHDSGDRGILQVVRAFGSRDFAFGGPGGAEFLDARGDDIVYAAAAESASGDHARYLMRDHITWLNRAPFVDRAGHEPVGY
jgi:hypothetical protein